MAADDDVEGYARAGAETAERYARWTRETVDRQFDGIRAVPRPRQPVPGLTPTTTFDAAMAKTIACAADTEAAVSAALVAEDVKIANGLGNPVASDIAERAILDDKGSG
jgi:hypothetical protein